MKIAILGIGLMGNPMAQRLCAAGFDVHVWNRTPQRAQHLAALGATVHATPALAVQNTDTVITMLENGPVVGSVLFELGAAGAEKCQASCRLSAQVQAITSIVIAPSLRLF